MRYSARRLIQHSSATRCPEAAELLIHSDDAIRPSDDELVRIKTYSAPAAEFRESLEVLQGSIKTEQFTLLLCLRRDLDDTQGKVLADHLARVNLAHAINTFFNATVECKAAGILEQ